MGLNAVGLLKLTNTTERFRLKQNLPFLPTQRISLQKSHHSVAELARQTWLLQTQIMIAIEDYWVTSCNSLFTPQLQSAEPHLDQPNLPGGRKKSGVLKAGDRGAITLSSSSTKTSSKKSSNNSWASVSERATGKCKENKEFEGWKSWNRRAWVAGAGPC